jgi:hypothetical protein
MADTITTRSPIQIETPTTVIVLAGPCPACADSGQPPGFQYDPLLAELRSIYRANYWMPGNANCTEAEQEKAQHNLAQMWHGADAAGYDLPDIDEGVGGQVFCHDCHGRGYLPTDALRAIRRALDLTGLATPQEG